MGKTIAVKISEREQQIIAELNKEGMTNSDLLRTALRHYFEVLHRTDLLQEPGKRTVDIDGIENPMIRDYIEYLKNEVRDLREQNTNLQQQIYYFSENDEKVQKEIIEEKPTPSVNVHDQIDEFLKRQYRREHS